MVNIKKIFISAGESSGDIYGARLAAAFKNNLKDVKLYGMGLSRMAAEGVELVSDVRKHSVMGITEILSSLYANYKNIKKCADMIRGEKIDTLVLIDYAGFNLKLAEAAKLSGIHTAYFIPPKLWAWGAFRMNGLKKNVDKVYSIFSFENDFFNKNGVNSVFLGHPIFDIIKLSGFDYDNFLSCEKAGGDIRDCRKNKIILMPGSRKSEISFLLPAVIESASEINRRYARDIEGLEFILPVAPSTDETLVKKHLKRARFNYRFVYSDIDKYNSFAQARFAIASSGTATLELALFGVPMVVVYKVAALTELVGRFLLKARYIGLPNILARACVAPELIQREVNRENIMYHASKLIPAGHFRNSAVKSLLNTAAILKYKRGSSPTDSVAADIYGGIGGSFESDKTVL
ncbi:MAG: Lipid-A-disaccharide synthase [bacterium ADurb.Bin243]|nr:MAG: Lipid-A-disaccharide synthase [bacterium ADurb.Bin243]HOD41646.1 lipid-A-disaccharide synthase [Candidatus Wallbacteria bacterium]